MGTGKTLAAINFINSSSDDCHFLYITQYLDEVQRIIKSCPAKNFQEPQSLPTKKANIKRLLEKGCNIASTHALFQDFTLEIADICRAQNYILIMDEVADVVKPYELPPIEVKNLLNNFAVVDPVTNMLRWREDKLNYTYKRFNCEYSLCEMETLFAYSDTVLLWLFPVKIFEAFTDVYILTYMFDCQLQGYYFKQFNVDYKYISVAGDAPYNYHFIDQPFANLHPKYNYQELIHVFNDDKINRLGDDQYALSKAWYKRNESNINMKQLRNNTRNFFEHRTRTPSSQNMWTTFIKYRPLVKSKPYSTGFVSLNMRASNSYRQKTAIAYLINRYMNTILKNFLNNQGIEIDEDAYALSEMLQFLWRSAIRDGKPIDVYIPSSRMRKLLLDWISNIC